MGLLPSSSPRRARLVYIRNYYHWCRSAIHNPQVLQEYQKALTEQHPFYLQDFSHQQVAPVLGVSHFLRRFSESLSSDLSQKQHWQVTCENGIRHGPVRSLGSPGDVSAQYVNVATNHVVEIPRLEGSTAFPLRWAQFFVMLSDDPRICNHQIGPTDFPLRWSNINKIKPLDPEMIQKFLRLVVGASSIVLYHLISMSLAQLHHAQARKDDKQLCPVLVFSRMEFWGSYVIHKTINCYVHSTTMRWWWNIIHR